MVELLFMPSVYTPCPTCHGTRFNAHTLAIRYRDRNIAEVLEMTVDQAQIFFADIPIIARSLDVLSEVGLGYLRLGQPATELSGGEAQRIKLATELQRAVSAGLERVKFFPAESLGGIAAIEALSGPFPDIRFLPSGGVSASNAPAYLASPAVFAVSGSWMAPRELIASADWDEISQRSAAAVSLLTGSSVR